VAEVLEGFQCELELAFYSFDLIKKFFCLLTLLFGQHLDLNFKGDCFKSNGLEELTFIGELFNRELPLVDLYAAFVKRDIELVLIHL